MTVIQFYSLGLPVQRWLFVFCNVCCFSILNDLIRIIFLKQEICDTHELLVKYEDLIAPDSSDPLHELLEDLGPVPSVATLLGSMCLAMLLKIESH